MNKKYYKIAHDEMSKCVSVALTNPLHTIYLKTLFAIGNPYNNDHMHHILLFYPKSFWL